MSNVETPSTEHETTYTLPTNVDEFFDRFQLAILPESSLYDMDKCRQNAEPVEEALRYFLPLKDSENLEETATKVLTEHPEAFWCIPSLTMIHDATKAFRRPGGTVVLINMRAMTNPVSDYVELLSKPGILGALKDAFNDPVKAICLFNAMGGDSHARKNRTGTFFETVVEDKISDLPLSYVDEPAELVDMTYTNQAKTKTSGKSKATCLQDLGLVDFSKLGDVVKKFDHVIRIKDYIIAIEDSCYNAGGSKPSETARSYKLLAEKAKEIKNLILVHIVDGQGWKSYLPNLADEMTEMKNVWCLADLENGALEQLVEKIKKEQEDSANTDS